MPRTLILNAVMINEGHLIQGDLLIDGERIEKNASQISPQPGDHILDANGKHLFPGMIDDQVHFREPGQPQKANMKSESIAAVAGGITSVMDMPNNAPPITTITALEDKFSLARDRMATNYSFYLGATNDNLSELQALDPNSACGIKVFMGSSTGNMLVDKPETLEAIFKTAPTLIATHCEDSPTIEANEALFREKYGQDVPIECHADIRSAEACYLSSSMAVELAKKHGTRLHVLHLTTQNELELFGKGPVEDKQISLEVCAHHLFFDQADYTAKGTLIKCNPSIKTETDRKALLKAVQNDVIDIIATDHAPHTLEEKQNTYFKAPSGLPLVQSAFQSILEHYHRGLFSLERIAEKTSHAVAKRYQIKDRGYIREGYFADLVLVDLDKPETVTRDKVLYKCGWSPFEGFTFNSSILATFVNGEIVYENGQVKPILNGQRLQFQR
jgi:dihydroorotase